MKHGTRYGYVKGGCRCDDCVAANRAENNARRARRIERARADSSIIPHGQKHAYRDYGCRCDLCHEAHTAATRRPGVTPRRVFTADEIAAAVEVYRTAGRQAAAESAGVSDATIAKWAADAGAECYKPPTKHTFGGAYRKGCRCGECIADMRRRAMENKASRLERFARGELTPPHGRTSTYSNYDCRCEPCRAAWSIRMAEYQKKRKTAA